MCCAEYLLTSSGTSTAVHKAIAPRCLVERPIPSYDINNAADTLYAARGGVHIVPSFLAKLIRVQFPGCNFGSKEFAAVFKKYFLLL